MDANSGVRTLLEPREYYILSGVFPTPLAARMIYASRLADYSEPSTGLGIFRLLALCLQISTQFITGKPYHKGTPELDTLTGKPYIT